MKQTRRQFSPELKRKAVRQLEAGQRLADVARALGVHAQVVRRWRDQVRIDPATAFPGNGRPLAEEAELQRADAATAGGLTLYIAIMLRHAAHH